MSPLTRTNQVTTTRRALRTSGSVAAALFVVGLAAQPATAMPDPPPPSPDPWNCVDLGRVDASAAAPAALPAAARDDTTEAAAILGGIGGILLTGGGVGLVALGRRRSRDHAHGVGAGPQPAV
jgi:hypothetical protein